MSPKGHAPPGPETTRGPCSGTGLAVVGIVSASVARNSSTVAHAGRCKVIRAGGGWLTRHVTHSTACAAMCQYLLTAPYSFLARMPVSRDNIIRLTASTPRVAFQGAPGAFSELAIQRQWPEGATPVPNDTFEGAVQCVLSNSAYFAAIPVENAIAGPVHVALVALRDHEAWLVRLGELCVTVHLCLMAPPGASLANLRIIRSHPMALAQCRMFCARHEWLVPEPHADTAGAARDVAALDDRTIGAVADVAAAQRYGLEILARSIEDVPANWTRFVIVSKR